MDIQQNVVLAPFTTFGIGGPADYFVVAKSTDEIIEAVKFAEEKEVPFFLLGTGANVLVGDKGYRGVVIKNEASGWKIEDRRLKVGSGATIAELIKVTAEKGLSGLEHFAGIPSSIGGALWQNLHFLSPDRSKTVFIGDIVEEAVIYSSSLRASDNVILNPFDNAQGEGSQSINKEKSFVERDSSQAQNDNTKTITVNRDYFHFAYDYSILHDNKDIVLSATFMLTPEDPAVIQERIAANLTWRAEKHPTNATKTSAGSVFKKIDGYGAGRLIEKVCLKGKVIGGAKISEHHANFIVNEGGATASDVRALIDLVQKTVKEELGLDMQTEISFIGEF